MKFLNRILTALLLLLLAGSIFQPLQVSAAPAAPNCNIVYQFPNGKTFTVNQEVAMKLMQTKADGSYTIDPTTNSYVIDPNKLLAFLNALQIQYPQKAKALTFYPTQGEPVTMAGDGYSNNSKRYLNVPREMAYLPQAIMSGANEVRKPELSVGNTYVEVDISDQRLYYYENLQIKFQTPVVTGNTNGHNTPKGVFSVNGKQRNVTLVGRGYSSFVNYWIPFIQSTIGIHDATWRSTFGGTIYQGNGSHGCVNVPLEAEEQLYKMIEVGTPVVVHL